MKKLFTILLCLFSMTAYANQVVMALLQPRVAEGSDPCRPIELNMVRGELRKAFGWQSNFQVLTRTDVDQMLKEHGFQQSGMVNDNQRKKVGEMTGAQYICVSTITKEGTQLYIEAYLVDVETGKMTNPATQYVNIMDEDYSLLPNSCNELAREMLGGLGSQTQSPNQKGDSQVTKRSKVREKNYEQKRNDRIAKIKQLTANQDFKCTQLRSNQLLYELYFDTDENNNWRTTGRTLALMIEIDEYLTTSVTILLRNGNNQDLDKILKQYKNLGTDVFANRPFQYSKSISEEQIAYDIKSYMEILFLVRNNNAEQIRSEREKKSQRKKDGISKIKELTYNRARFKCTQLYSDQLLYELYLDTDENNKWITTGRTLALMIEIDENSTTSVTVLLRNGNNQDLDKILKQYKNLGTDVFANIPFKYSYSISEEQIAYDIKSYMEILFQVRNNYAKQIRRERENNYVNGHRAVDMGLSVRWADCNVGAGSPDDIGHYYAWGEVSPKTSYNSQTYKHCLNTKWVLKYCTMSDYGNVDNKLVLDSQDDAATVNWGEGWSTPTKEQWQELANGNNCTWEWITTMRVPGYKVTSKITKNSIFIPITGYKIPAGYQLKNLGLYWTSSLYPYIWNNHYYAAYRFDMRQTSFDTGPDYRENGRQIRAVHKEQSKNYRWVRLSDIQNNKESYKFRKIRLHFDRYTMDRDCYCHIKYADNNQLALEFCFTSSGDYIINHQGKNYQITNRGEYIGNNTYEYDLNNLCGTIDQLFYVSSWQENFLPEQVEIYTEQVRIQSEAEERDRAISKADGYVDLGLPSGTLWKTENEDCGLVTYDKAYELYGNSLPTYEQLKELNDKCQWIWKGNGYKIIGKNGETIFMPAEGYRPCDGSTKLVGSYGYCWASTPVGSEKAWRLGFCSNNVYLNALDRCVSFSVRLVR